MTGSMQVETDRRTHVTIFASVAFLLLGTGLHGTLVGVRASIEGMGDMSIGAVMSSFFLGYALGSMFAPRLIRQVGYIRTFAALASLASAVALAPVLLVSPPFWGIMRALNGACYAGMIIVTESWINDATDRRDRGKVLAVYNTVVLGGWALSQPLLTLSDPSGFALFCLVSILISLSLLPVTLARITDPGVMRGTKPRIAHLYRISPFGTLGLLVVGISMNAYWGMGPSFAEGMGYPDKGIALFMSSSMFGALAFQWPLGLLSDRVDRRLVILGSAAAAGASSLFFAMTAGRSSPLVFPFTMMYGGFGVSLYSLSISHIYDYAGEDDRVAVASAIVVLYGLGSAAGPIIASSLMAVLGPLGLFVFCSLMQVFLFLFGLYRLRLRPALPRRLKNMFKAVPRTSHMILHVGSRTSSKGKNSR